jgi:hypothetical protein
VWHGNNFISYEPAIGLVDIEMVGSFGTGQCLVCAGAMETAGHYDAEDGMGICDACGGTGIDGNAWVDWVICGCESGPKARVMMDDWARDMRDQCVEQDVPFFLKQMMVGGKLVKEPELDGRQWLQFPEVK